jgi:hypothetical protein
MDDAIEKIVNRPIVQICYVVKNVEEAVQYWADTVGAGPFFITGKQEYIKTFVYGVESPINHAGAVGQWGPLQVELYQPLDFGPANIIPPAGGMGQLHHINMGFVDDLEAEKKRLFKLGIVPALEYWSTIPEGAKTCIFDTRHICGHMIEVYEEHEGMRHSYKWMQRVAATWDRTSPLGTPEMIASYFDE